MQGKQLALSFVSPFRSIMPSSQVSCSTNLRHLMAGERNEVGEAPKSSPGGQFWPSHLCSDSIFKMLLFESLFLSISVFSQFALLPKTKQTNKPPNSSLYYHFLSLEVYKMISANSSTCLSSIFPQTPVHPSFILTSHPCHGKQSHSALCQLLFLQISAVIIPPRILSYN